MATDLLIEQMEDAPESLDAGTKLDIAKTFADRSGFGPASKTTNVNVHIGLAERLGRARQRAGGGATDAPANLLPAPKEVK
jgi:hypothetical protein